MTDLTVFQAGGAILWGVFAILPVGLAAFAQEDEGNDAVRFISLMLQVAFGIACYWAGTVAK
jgi:hypothetical protein